MRSPLLAAVALLVPLTALGTPADDVAERFVDVLRNDDLQRLANLVDDQERDPHAWDELRNLIDRHDCIRVDRYVSVVESSTKDHIALRIELEGQSALKAVWRPERRLPRVWHIEARQTGANWRVSRAFTEERRIAAAMVQAPNAFEAGRLAASFGSDPSVDPLRLISLYADEISLGKDPARFEHALELARSTGDVSTELDVLRAYARGSVTDRPRMLAISRDAERLARESGNRDGLAAALLTLGAAQWINADHEGARASYSAAADMAEVLDDPTTAIKALQMVLFIGQDVKTDTSPIETIKIVDRQVELAVRYGWEEGQVLGLLNRASLHTRFGDMAFARANTLEALRLSELQGNRRFVAILNGNVATIDADEGRYEEAASRLRQALTLSTGDDFAELEMLIRLAAVEHHLGHLDEAEAVLQRAEKAGTQDVGKLAAIDEGRGNIQLSRGHAAVAVDLFRRALDALDAEGRNDYGRRMAAVTGLARSLNALGREDEVLELYRGAVSRVEVGRNELGSDAIGRSAFLAGFIDVYVSLVDALVQRGLTGEAFHVAEQMRARSLREAIDESKIDRSAMLSTEERSREAALASRVVESNKKLMAARKGAGGGEAMEKELSAARIALDAYRTELRIAHPSVARRRLDSALAQQLPAGSESMALIEYVVANEAVIAFVVTSGQPIHAVRLPIPRKTLEREALELVNLLEARSPAYARQARRMHAALIAPLRKYVRGKTSLAIAPDGVLWTVPFQALPGTDGRYLVDRYAVFYAPSLSLLRDASSLQSTSPPDLLALGNPTLGGEARSTVRSAFRDASLGSLADAEAEVRSLASLYPPERRRVYTRVEASETVFKETAPHAGIIHLAAHALVDDRAPMYSAIVLARHGNDADDGLLEAREIIDLPLNAELTVLSACQTARGKIGSGEGVIGLSWALFAAGCPTTVVSQWDAESAATAKLMVELHRHLRAGDTTAIALQKAQASVRRSETWRHPFYWAPFIALGAANRPLTAH
jgi:CHAT domain-containing protein